MGGARLVVIMVARAAFPLAQEAKDGDAGAQFTGQQDGVEAVGQHALVRVLVRVLVELDVDHIGGRLGLRAVTSVRNSGKSTNAWFDRAAASHTLRGALAVRTTIGGCGWRGAWKVAAGRALPPRRPSSSCA